MSKFLIVTDIHLSGKNPTQYIGDYWQDTFAKFIEILQLSKQYKCEAIFSGGDLLDSPLLSLTLTDLIIDAINKNNIPFYAIPGNHEENNHNWSLSENTTLAHMFRRSDLIKFLDTYEDDKVIIKGWGYYHGIEDAIKEGLLNVPKTKKWKIGLVHALITEKKFLPSVLHVQAETIQSNIDAIFSGHYHQPYHIIGDTEVYNLGAIGLRDINEIKIKPSVVIIDTLTREVTPIQLKNVRKGKELFDLAGIEASKEYDKNIDDFIASLETSVVTEEGLRGSIEGLAKEKNIDKDIITDLINRVGLAEDK